MRFVALVLVAVLTVGLAIGPATADTEARPALVVAIAKDGKLYVAAKQVSDENLVPELKRFVNGDREAKLTIAADRDAKYARVAFVVDAAKQAGITHVQMLVDKPKKSATSR